MNDEESRIKIRQRTAAIDQAGSIEAKDLPDTRLELRQQQIEEYKAKMKRGS